MTLNLWPLIFPWRFLFAMTSWKSRGINAVDRSLVRHRHKIHKYRDVDNGSEFVIEPSQDQTYYLMTSQRSGLVLGDYVLVQGTPHKQQYKILEIDYYANSCPDFWIAKLQPIQVTVYP